MIIPNRIGVLPRISHVHVETYCHSLFVHEVAHVARRTLQGELLGQAEAAFQVEGGKWTRAQEEAFAKGFEHYLKEGIAPTAELKSVFQKAAEFLARIYKNLQEVLHITDDIRSVYDTLLGAEHSGLAEAETRLNEAERVKQAKKNTSGKYVDTETYEKNKITETAEDKKLDDKALKEKYMAYAKENFQGNSYHNADTDTDIRISRDILDEWQSKTKSREQILSIQILDKLIETAVETNTVSDKKNREEINNIKYFETGLSVNETMYKAHLTVREIQDNTNKAYHYYLEDVRLEDILIDQIKKEAALRIDAHLKQADVPLLHGSPTNIAENAESINTGKTLQGTIDEAYTKAAEAARRAMDQSIKQSTVNKKDNKAFRVGLSKGWKGQDENQWIITAI